MLSKRLMDEMNLQIMYELASGHLYTAMEAYCASVNLEGFANWLKVQTEEERAHGRLFFDFINKMNGEAKIYGIEEPQGKYQSLLQVFQNGYEHEQFVTDRIYLLADIATEEKNHAAISFLKWFVDEQVEEESNFLGIIKKLELIGDNTSGLYMLDKELAARVYVPPTIAV
ncbi:MAG: ferritin [Clostridiales bacterium GWB2_37_7]|nr:MAG: ferritin [Clostridiales bacterium GWB2_37_7]